MKKSTDKTSPTAWLWNELRTLLTPEQYATLRQQYLEQQRAYHYRRWHGKDKSS